MLSLSVENKMFLYPLFPVVSKNWFTIYSNLSRPRSRSCNQGWTMVCHWIVVSHDGAWMADFVPWLNTIHQTIAWMRLQGLSIKYWKPHKILEKAAKVGVHLLADNVTEPLWKLGYAKT